MKAKQLIEAMKKRKGVGKPTAGGAPTTMPDIETEPDVETQPDVAPGPKPPRHKPGHHDPYHPRKIEPDEEPAPKAHGYGGYPYESQAGVAKAIILGESFGTMMHGSPGDIELNVPMARQALNQIKQRFIEERTRGYVDRHGVRQPPVSLEEAEALWTQIEPRFARSIYAPDPETGRKLGIAGRRGRPQGEPYGESISRAKAIILGK